MPNFYHRWMAQRSLPDPVLKMEKAAILVIYTYMPIMVHMWILHGISMTKKVLTLWILAYQILFFKSVQFIQINKVKYAPISLDELQVYSEKLTKCDALLINTGFSKFRDENPSYYFKETPGFTEEAAEYISQFKNIKCIGFDFISVENIIRNREKGYPIHHILLSREIPIILIEDMKLDDVIGKGIKRLFVIPIRIRGIEASPVTAFAEVDL